MFKFKHYYVFYRHFLYGSALSLGTAIGSNFVMPSLIGIAMYTAGSLLMLSSGVITYTVNRYPDEFVEELADIIGDEEEYE